MKISSLFLLASGPFLPTATAQSAKFSASWETGSVDLYPLTETGVESIQKAEELLATIRSPKQKELLIGVSGVVNIVTFTEAKGKNKEPTAISSAEAAVQLEVKYAPTGTPNICSSASAMSAAPGPITLASRKQTLAVTVDLDVVDNNLADGNDLAETLAIEGSVTVALELDTTAAHHFNFVAPDLAFSQEYDVVACFTGAGGTSIIEEGVASSYIAVHARMLTVQQVRAVQGDFIDANV